MNDSRDNDSDLLKNLNSSQPLETSDKVPPLETDVSPTVAALQDEVIRLRDKGRPETKKFLKKADASSTEQSDAINGQVQDYSPLLSSLNPSTTLSKVDKPAPLTPAEGQANDELLAALKVAKSPVSIAIQENLIKTSEKLPEVKVAHVKQTSETTQVLDSNEQIVTVTPASLNASSAPVLASNNRSFDKQFSAQPSNAETTIAFNPTSKPIEKPVAAATHTETPLALNNDIPSPNSFRPTNTVAALPSESTNTRSFSANVAMSNPGKPVADSTVIAQNPTNPSIQPTFQNPDSISKNSSSNLQSVDRPLIASLNPATQPQAPRDVISQPVAPTDKQTYSKEQIAFNPSTPLQTPSTPTGQEASPKHQELAKPSLVAQDTSTQGARTANLNQNLIAERQDVPSKESQIASAINFPKYGGAPAVEESTKAVVPQAANPQSFQSSFARDSAPEKAHPLSESFVSGKVLSQPTKGEQVTDSKTFTGRAAEAKGNDPKAPDVKSADAKSVDIKSVDAKSVDAKSVDTKSVDAKSVDAKSVDTKFADAKSADIKSVDAKFIETKSADTKLVDARSSDIRSMDGRAGDPRQIEGRIADPRNIDGSHLPNIPNIKPGSELAAANPNAQPLPTDRVLLGTTGPKADGTNIDITDKGGKKQDSSDDKKDGSLTGKGPGGTADTGKTPGSKAFNDLLDFIDKADQADVKPGGKALTPLTGSNILSPDDVLITGTGAIGQGISGAIGDNSKDETTDDDKLSHRRKKYIVQDGDTIDSIAKAELGDARYANLILTINQANIASRVQDGKKIAIKLDPGQIIWLPSDHELQVHAEIYLLD